MKHLVRARGGDEDRLVVTLAEELDRHIDIADIDEPSRQQLELIESLAVDAHDRAVVGALRHIGVMARIDLRADHGLEIEHVDGIVGALNERIGLRGRVVDERFEQGFTADAECPETRGAQPPGERARGQIAQEGTP
jgi:hypothetical protein